MRHPAPSSLALLAGVLGLCLLSLTVAPVVLAAGSSSEASVAPSGTRWVKIDLVTADASGDIQMGKPFDLSIAIGGVSQGGAPLVAICESVSRRSLVPSGFKRNNPPAGLRNPPIGVPNIGW